MTDSENVPNVPPPALTEDTLLTAAAEVVPVKRYQVSGNKYEHRQDAFDTKEEVATFVSMLVSEGFTTINVTDAQEIDYPWL